MASISVCSTELDENGDYLEVWETWKTLSAANSSPGQHKPLSSSLAGLVNVDHDRDEMNLPVSATAEAAPSKETNSSPLVTPQGSDVHVELQTTIHANGDFQTVPTVVVSDNVASSVVDILKAGGASTPDVAHCLTGPSGCSGVKGNPGPVGKTGGSPSTSNTVSPTDMVGLARRRRKPKKKLIPTTESAPPVASTPSVADTPPAPLPVTLKQRLADKVKALHSKRAGKELPTKRNNVQEQAALSQNQGKKGLKKNKVKQLNQMLDSMGLVDPGLRVKFADAVMNGRVNTPEQMNELARSLMTSQIQLQAPPGSRVSIAGQEPPAPSTLLANADSSAAKPGPVLVQPSSSSPLVSTARVELDPPSISLPPAPVTVC